MFHETNLNKISLLSILFIAALFASCALLENQAFAVNTGSVGHLYEGGIPGYPYFGGYPNYGGFPYITGYGHSYDSDHSYDYGYGGYSFYHHHHHHHSH